MILGRQASSESEFERIRSKIQCLDRQASNENEFQHSGNAFGSTGAGVWRISSSPEMHLGRQAPIQMQVAYPIPKCAVALARRLSIQMRFLCDQMRSRSTPVDPNAFPLCSDAFSLDASRSKCVAWRSNQLHPVGPILFVPNRHF